MRISLSRRRSQVVVAVLAIAVAALLVVVGDSGSHRPAKESVSVTAGQDVAPGPLDKQGVWDPYYSVIGGGAGAGVAAQRQWKPVVRGFVTGFLNASRDAKWLTKVTPLVSPQLLRRLHWVVRSRVPVGTVSAIDLDSAGPHVADVAVTYTSGGAHRTLAVGVVDLPKDGRGWMVYSYRDTTS